MISFAATFFWPGFSIGQEDRDYVFEDEDGYRVLRFAGAGSGERTEEQLAEISNAEFSSMVHDRILADLRFVAEPPDETWASAMEPRISQHLTHAGPESSWTVVECRSDSCRIVIEHTGDWTLSTHLPLMETVQLEIEAFIDAAAPTFDPVFLITAYDQASETPHIKAFLRRAK